MGLEKIGVRKNAGLTLTTLVVNLLLVVFIFSAGFLYLQQNVENVGDTLDTKYNNTYNNLVNSSTDLDDNIKDIQNKWDEVGEADNIAQVAWNGLRGLGALLLLPISFVSTANSIFQATLEVAGLPAWISNLITIGLVGIVVFLVLALLKGESKM